MDNDRINDSIRDESGRFVKGYKHSDLPLDFKDKIRQSMSNSWKDREDYIADLVNECPYIYNSWRGIMFSKKGKKAGVYCGDNHRIGCDRIDNNKGYTKDNVVPCCIECNTARNNYFSFEEMKLLGQTIRQIKQSRKKE